MKLRLMRIITIGLCLQLSFAQKKSFAQLSLSPVKKIHADSARGSSFKQLTEAANVIFYKPRGFYPVTAVNNEDYTFDYAMTLPRSGFEVWYQVRSQKENWASFERSKLSQKQPLANPDSVYKDIAQAHAIAFSGDRNSFVKVLPPAVLRRYNADAGRSYLLTLQDSPETKHYQYALLIALQKFHTGTVLMVCFTNEKTPAFYQNVERAGKSLKFKHSTADVNKLAY